MQQINCNLKKYGPYEVIKKIKNNNYIIYLLKNIDTLKCFSVSNIY